MNMRSSRRGRGREIHVLSIKPEPVIVKINPSACLRAGEGGVDHLVLSGVGSLGTVMVVKGLRLLLYFVNIDRDSQAKVMHRRRSSVFKQ